MGSFEPTSCFKYTFPNTPSHKYANSDTIYANPKCKNTPSNNKYTIPKWWNQVMRHQNTKYTILNWKLGYHSLLRLPSPIVFAMCCLHFSSFQHLFPFVKNSYRKQFFRIQIKFQHTYVHVFLHHHHHHCGRHYTRYQVESGYNLDFLVDFPEIIAKQTLLSLNWQDMSNIECRTVQVYRSSQYV